MKNAGAAKNKLQSSKRDIPVAFVSCEIEKAYKLSYKLSYKLRNSQNTFFSEKGLIGLFGVR